MVHNSSSATPAWVKYAWTTEATEWFLGLPKHAQSRIWLPTFSEIKYNNLDACQELLPSEDFLMALLTKYREDHYAGFKLDDDPLVDAILGADHHSRSTWFNWDGLYLGTKLGEERAERLFSEFARPFFLQDDTMMGNIKPSLSAQPSLLAHPDLPKSTLFEGFYLLLDNVPNPLGGSEWRVNLVDTLSDLSTSSETLAALADIARALWKSQPENNRDEGFFVDCMASLTINPAFPEAWVNDHNSDPSNTNYPVYFPGHDDTKYKSMYPGSYMDAKISAIPRHPKRGLNWRMWYATNEISAEEAYEEGESSVLDPAHGGFCLPFVGFYFEANRLSREIGTDGEIPASWVSNLIG